MKEEELFQAGRFPELKLFSAKSESIGDWLLEHLQGLDEQKVLLVGSSYLHIQISQSAAGSGHHTANRFIVGDVTQSVYAAFLLKSSVGCKFRLPISKHSTTDNTQRQMSETLLLGDVGVETAPSFHSEVGSCKFLRSELSRTHQ